MSELGAGLNPLLILPFAGMLLSIAILPLVAGRWFSSDRNRALVSALFGAPVLLYILVSQGHAGVEAVFTTFEHYVSLIVLLASLFVVSGGIFLTGELLGTPRSNLAFLGIGALLANVVGTTGAAMLLVRPLLRANRERRYRTHIVVFTVMVVCNIGGMLTPLGDPPLFLGFLGGVDFWWTLRLFPIWALGVGLTLLVFYVVERRLYARESPLAIAEDVADYVPLGVEGRINILLLLGIVAAVLASEPLAEVGHAIHFPFVREVVMLVMAGLSLRLGPAAPRAKNEFSWAPIVEVAVVFAGIFASMIPALAILEARGGELGLDQPWMFYWATGLLSGFLDNAPTYLTFAATAIGLLDVDGLAGLTSQAVVPAVGHAPASFLAAISAGAVMMGAITYIGNAPNFMVKSIAEESGVKMPHFFGYMAYALAVLVPVFAVVTLVFFV
ncbi:MAG: sodium:proton antiporter [Actinobacteria bacterium]|nr:sodium:proton antiporter [Actinomycetota bacterium]